MSMTGVRDAESCGSALQESVGWASVHGLGTSLPRRCSQVEVRNWLVAHLGGLGIDSAQLESVFAHSPIRSRRIAMFDSELSESALRRGEPRSISASLEAFRPAARRLAEASGRQALTRASVDPLNLTHLVVVTSTGGALPATDIDLIVDLGLRRTVRRTLLSGMGCSGMFHGLETARCIVAENPSATVLLTGVEVCSVHPQSDGSRSASVADSLFSDAAVSAVIGAAGAGDLCVAEYGPQISLVVPEKAGLIRWDLGDEGFEINLSPRLPIAIGQLLLDFVSPVVKQITGSGVPADVSSWALHGGGTAILSQIQSRLNLPESAISSARRILEENGNLSSLSVMFALVSELGRRASGTPGIMLGFGPGLALEAIPYRTGKLKPANPFA